MTPYYEQIARFGIRQNLNGIFAEPRGGRHADKPAIVILNSGVVHRIGHHRMYVTMARMLAAAGYPVLRFDFSGIGDSASRSESLEPDAAAMADIVSAVDWLSETRGIKTAVLLGLCSGADIALKYGHTDDRIVALVLLDPTIPPTWKFYLHYLSQRATNMQLGGGQLILGDSGGLGDPPGPPPQPTSNPQPKAAQPAQVITREMKPGSPVCRVQ